MWSDCLLLLYLLSDIYKKGNDIVPMSFYFVNFAFGEGSLSLRYLTENKEALCLSCNWKPEKFSNYVQDGIVVLTLRAWAAIIVFVRKGFLRTSN